MMRLRIRGYAVTMGLATVAPIHAQPAGSLDWHHPYTATSKRGSYCRAEFTMHVSAHRQLVLGVEHWHQDHAWQPRL